MNTNDMNDDVTIEPEKGTAQSKNVDQDASDDVVFEDDGASLKDKLKELRVKLKQAEEEKLTYLTGWQKDKAEFINAHRRDEEQRKEFIKYANEALIEELIPVLDSFELARANKEAWEKVEKNWRIGVEYIQSQLKSALERAGLKEISPAGQAYNPTTHEAVGMQEVTDAAQEGKIVEVKSKGYELSGKSVRAPKVIVGEHKA
jgi:molecular chaperone GrpE